MYTVAIANHKGGVGKTFTAVRLATELGRSGQRVLLLDADPQAHATLYLLGGGAEELERDLSDIMDGAPLRDIMMAVSDEQVQLVPSSLRVAEMEFRLVADPGRRDQRLKRALEELADDVDLVLIDCPPSLSLLTVNALAAADGIVAPVQLTNFALDGLSRFLTWVDDFRREGMVRAELLGVLPTFYDRRQQADRDGLIVLHNTGFPLFEPVPRRTAVERVVAARIAGQDLEDLEELDRVYGVVAKAILHAASTPVSVP
jgi:chromosome partitioning protein